METDLILMLQFGLFQLQPVLLLQALLLGFVLLLQPLLQRLHLLLLLPAELLPLLLKAPLQLLLLAQQLLPSRRVEVCGDKTTQFSHCPGPGSGIGPVSRAMSLVLLSHSVIQGV